MTLTTDWIAAMMFLTTFATFAVLTAAPSEPPNDGPRDGSAVTTASVQRQTRPAARADTRRPAGGPDLEILRVQVMLDRAGFSPGALDGRMGRNTTEALNLYKQRADPQAAAEVEPVIAYVITPEDAAGPFVPAIPRDLVQQAALPSLAYTSVLEALAERFHSTPALLQHLNPAAAFTAGEQIQVPNVEPLVVPVERPVISPEAAAADKSAKPQAAGTSGRRGSGPAAARQPNTVAQRPDVVVTVSKRDSALTVQDAAGAVIFRAPVTTGSEHDPLPIGEWKVNGVQFNPSFNYNPDLFWDADPAHSKAKIPAGPNNPVGLVWIDLSKEHYGIHGTPEPQTIGKTESHGCVRLTNWDALKLAGMVKPGTRVVFTE